MKYVLAIDQGTTSSRAMLFDKNGQPFSLIASTIDLQDRYDLLLYSCNNLIASAGTVGD